MVKVVVGIDIGTSRSGYALAYCATPDNITLPVQKVLSHVLLDTKGDCIAFGDEAQIKYNEWLMYTRETNQENTYMFFSKFKMALYEISDQSLHKTFLIAENGIRWSTLLVFRAIIHALSNTALQKIQEQTNNTIESKDIKWVLTIPAIWNDLAKQILREAATLTDVMKDDRFCFAYESECAAITCRSDYETLQQQHKIYTGQTICVIDLGGGTADFAIHLLQKDGGAREAWQSSGGPWGAECVEQAFIVLLKEVFGSVQIEEYSKNHILDWYDLMQDFERVKNSITSFTDASYYRRLRLPMSFVNQSGINVEECIHRYNHKHDPFVTDYFDIKTKHEPVQSSTKTETLTTVSSKIQLPDLSPLLQWQMGVLCIRVDVLRSLFNTSVQNIVHHLLHEILNKTSCNHVFLAGGYAENDFVYQSIVTAVHKHDINIVVTRSIQPTFAVLTGAVKFGLNQSIIQSRIMKYTYALEVARPYTLADAKQDRPISTVIRNGSKLNFELRAALNMVRAGESLINPYVFKTILCPVLENQEYIMFLIYITKDTDVQYTDSKNMKCHGTVRVDIGRGSLDRKFEVSVTFGDTDVHFEVINTSSNNSKQSFSITFL